MAEQDSNEAIDLSKKVGLNEEYSGLNGEPMYDIIINIKDKKAGKDIYSFSAIVPLELALITADYAIKKAQKLADLHKLMRLDEIKAPKQEQGV